jgi:DNA repair protein RAD50
LNQNSLKTFFLSPVKIELAELGAHKHAAEGIRKELQEQTEALESVEDMKKEYEKKIEKIEKKIDGLSGIIFQGQEITMEIDACNNDQTQFAVLIQKQRSMLEEDLTRKYDLQQLNDLLRNFDEKIAVQLERKEELEAKYRQLMSSIENERQEEMNLTSKFGKAQAEKEAHDKRLRDRYRLMERMAQAYTLDLTQLSQSQNIDTSFVASLSQSMMGADDATQDDSSLISITPEDMQGFFCSLEEKEAKLKKDLEALRDNFQKDEDKLMLFLTDHGGKLHAIETGEYVAFANIGSRNNCNDSFIVNFYRRSRSSSYGEELSGTRT